MLASTAGSCFPRLFGLELNFFFPFSASQRGPSPRAKAACEVLPPLGSVQGLAAKTSAPG